MKLEEVLQILRSHEAEIRAHGVKSLAVFGSVARGEAHPDSDVDLLVEFDQRVGLFGLVKLKLYLEGILSREVDLVTPSGLRPSMRDSVLREAVRAA